MRKDSWFRGAVLSILFFALIVGGVPLPASAQLPDGGGETITVTAPAPTYQPGNPGKTPARLEGGDPPRKKRGTGRGPLNTTKCIARRRR